MGLAGLNKKRLMSKNPLENSLFKVFLSVKKLFKKKCSDSLLLRRIVCLCAYLGCSWCGWLLFVLAAQSQFLSRLCEHIVAYFKRESRMAAAVLSLEDRGKHFVCQFCRERDTLAEMCVVMRRSGVDWIENDKILRWKIKCAHHTPQYLHDCPCPSSRVQNFFFLCEGSQDMIILEEKNGKK